MAAHTAGIERLIELFAGFPGVGARSAERMAYHVLKGAGAATDLANAIGQVVRDTRHCTVCFNYAEDDRCRVCSDERREQDRVCVVESESDVVSIEKTGVYKGVYHVLQGRVAPMDGVGPEDIRIEELLRRVKEGDVSEVILATNPTMEGDSTANYIAGLLADQEVKVTRIARGMPTGSNLEYASKAILTDAMEGRREI